MTVYLGNILGIELFYTRKCLCELSDNNVTSRVENLLKPNSIFEMV